MTPSVKADEEVRSHRTPLEGRDSNPRSFLATISFSNAAASQQFNSTLRNRPRVLAYEALAAAGIPGLTVGKHRYGIIAVDDDTYDDSSALPASIQYGRSASHTLRIVCPNGHLGFAPIKTGRFRIGCDCEPDLICADSGSCDVGPVPVGADISSSPRQSQVDDLEECCSPLMPEIVADPLSLSCYHLFPGPRIQGSQWLAPDLFFLARGVVRSEPVGANPVGRPRYLYVN